MHKREYFLAALNYGSFLYKGWVIDCFSQVQYPEKNVHRKPDGDYPIYFPNEPIRQSFEEYPYQLFTELDQIVFFDPATNQWDVLQGAELNKPPFRFKQEIELKAGDLANVTEDFKTLVGNVLVNQTVLCYPFGNRIPFQKGKVNLGKIEDIIAGLLQTPPENKEERDPKFIYTDEVEERYYPAAFSISGWCQLGAPAATPYTIVPPPNIKEIREKIVEKYRSEGLNNSATIAKISKELSDIDVAFQNQDPEKGFLRPGTKDFDAVRMKMFLSHGQELDFVDKSKVTYIENPLAEGWDITKLPEMVNSLIDGSFSRGALTALGGEAAKFIGRFFLNTIISENDCGSHLGILHKVTKDTEVGYHWAYFFDEKNELKLMTPELASQSHGKTYLFRSPMYCHTGNGNFCVTCIGKRFENSRNGLGGTATEVGSILQSISMAAMHAQALRLEKWDWQDTLK